MILSLVQGGYLLGVENLGGRKELVAWLRGGRTFEGAVEFAIEENGRTACVLVEPWGR